MFLGTYTPRLDDKHRLVLPARFREPLADGLVITRGQERCLCVWPVEGFRTATRQLSAAPLTSKSARDYLRVLFAGAHDEIPDKQGRVTVPQPLRDYAGARRTGLPAQRASDTRRPGDGAGAVDGGAGTSGEMKPAYSPPGPCHA